MNGLILHAGAQSVTLDDVIAVTTPEPTETWTPVAHHRVIESVKAALAPTGFAAVEEEYGLWGDDGERMFGVLGLENGSAHDDYRLVVGIRNSHDKRFSLGIAVGSSVFICDNLAFSSEIYRMRKHTRWIDRDLDRLIFEAMGELGNARDAQDARITNYKLTDLTETMVHDIIIRSVDAKVMANAYIAKVLQEWRAPDREDFAPRTAWSLFNAFTQIFKATNPLDLTDRTTRLHGLMDAVVDATEQRQVVEDLLTGTAIVPFTGVVGDPVVDVAQLAPDAAAPIALLN